MSVFDDYSGVFGGKLTDEERAELGKFASDLIQAKAANDEEAIKVLIKEATEALNTNYDDFEAFIGLATWIEKYASVESDKRRTLGNILAIIGAAGALTGPIAAGAKWVSRKATLNKSKAQILKENPALSKDPKFEQYFTAISSFAPDVAAQPLLAGNVLEQLRRLGPAAVTPQLINELLGLQGRMGMSTDTLKMMSDGFGRAAEIGAKRISDNETNDLKKDSQRSKEWYATYKRTQDRQKDLGEKPLKPGSYS